LHYLNSFVSRALKGLLDPLGGSLWVSVLL
jgi:hypothetical protein